MRDAMSGIGLIEPDRAPITYNERAPLVMPPSLGGKSAKHGKSAKAGLDTNVPLTLPRELADPETLQQLVETYDLGSPVGRLLAALRISP